MNIFRIKRRISGIINLVGTRRGVFCPQHKVKSGRLGYSAFPLSGTLIERKNTLAELKT